MTDETDNVEWLRGVLEHVNGLGASAKELTAIAAELQQLRAERENLETGIDSKHFELIDAREELSFLRKSVARYSAERGALKLRQLKCVPHVWADDEDCPYCANSNLSARIAALEAEQGEHSALMEFYNVTTVRGLVAAMLHHIEKLQSKLPPTRDEQPRTPREG